MNLGMKVSRKCSQWKLKTLVALLLSIPKESHAHSLLEYKQGMRLL